MPIVKNNICTRSFSSTSLLRPKTRRTFWNTLLSNLCLFFSNRGLVAFILFILGLETLLPWNFFITALGVRRNTFIKNHNIFYCLLGAMFHFCLLQYFNERLNTTTSSNVSNSEQTDPYMFNNMCVLISQLPLLLFTLLNSFLYQQWVTSLSTATSRLIRSIATESTLFCSIPERMRIAGSMVFILLFFILTATLVKVEMKQNSFFSITMAIIWFINSMQIIYNNDINNTVTVYNKYKYKQNWNTMEREQTVKVGLYFCVKLMLSGAWVTMWTPSTDVHLQNWNSGVHTCS